MTPLVTRPVTVAWEAPPELVAASIQRAISEDRYDDFGHPEWPFWRVRGTVRDQALDLRLTTHSQPGSQHAYQSGFELRGELRPRGTGTELVGRAAMLGGQRERPLALVVGAALGAPLLLFGGIVGVAACAAVAASFFLVYRALIGAFGRGVFGAIPQAEAALRTFGTPDQHAATINGGAR